MRRATFIALGLLLVSLVAVVLGTAQVMRQAQRQLADELALVSLRQAEEVRRGLEEELAGVIDRLELVGELWAGVDARAAHDLDALVGATRHAIAAAALDADGRVLARAGAAQAPGVDVDAAWRAVAATSLPQAGDVTITPVDARAARPWLRCFALRTKSGGRLALLVDTEPMFARLRVVGARPDTHFIVLGGDGQPSPGTSTALMNVLRDAGAPGVVGRLLARMQAKEGGTLMIGADDAARLGLPRAEIIAAHVPIDVSGGRAWALAILSSTTSLREVGRTLVARLAAGAAGVVACLLGFAIYLVMAARRDSVTRERLRQADALAHLHEKTEKVLDNIPAGVLVLAEDGRVTSLNRALRQRLSEVGGGADDGAAGLAQVFPAAPQATVARIAALVASARASGVVGTLTGELALFGGESQYLVHAVPLEPRFPEARMLLVVEDLSQVHLLEERLLRAEKLATVGVLAAGIAHEIGTPLGIVRARAEYIAGKLAPDHPQTSGLRVIIEQIDRASRTIRQLLDFARVQPAAVRAVALAPVAQAVCELLRLNADKQGVRLTLDVAPDCPQLLADADQLQQVLLNLALNACDACASGGRVTIAAALDDDPRWRRVRIEVRDTGSGIAPEHRNLIFDPFFTTKKRGQGTGLGLPVCAKIVRNHGGQLELQSEPGRGTTAIVLWPIPDTEKTT